MILTQALVKKGQISKEQAKEIEDGLKKSNKTEEEAILETGLVSESALFNLKSEVFRIELKEVPTEEIPLKVLEIIPEEAAKFYKIIPLGQNHSILEVGMVYPEDLKAQEALKFLIRQSNLVAKTYLISSTTFNSLLRQYRTLREEVKKALDELEVEMKRESVRVQNEKKSEFDKLVEDAPISKVVNVILRYAIEGNASDIHIEPMKKNLRVRFRMDGSLHASIILPLKVLPAIVARIKILSNLRLDETRIPQDGRFSTSISDKEIDFRVSTFPTSMGEKVALRVLDPTKGLVSFEKLGITGRDLATIEKEMQKPYGLILITGPTGSGKSTTLYTILNLLNKEGSNIITLEDPIEYYMEGINQSQVRPEIGYSFATGLRQILRQDPDIIMVGEIRDEETASLAMNASLTGHLVLSTLHTNNAIGVIPRLIDMKVSPFLLPPALSLAIAQRLIKLLCPECKKRVEASKATKELIMHEVETLPESVRKKVEIKDPLYLYEAKGCKKCNNRGYKGRMGIFEVLEMTKGLEKIILGNPSEAEIYEEAKKQEMITMKQNGLLKVLQGLTTVEEVLRVAEEK